MINNYSILKGGKYFVENGSKSYLLFQQFFRFTSKNGKIYSWWSKETSEENNWPLSTTDKSFYPEIIYKHCKGKTKILKESF